MVAATNAVSASVRRRICVAMSGGVDSSVAAHLLKKSCPNSDVVGLHMSNWDASDEDYPSPPSSSTNSNRHPANPTSCSTSDIKKDTSNPTSSTYCVQSEKDASDAQDVCDALGIDMHRASFAAEYWTGVFEPFVDGIVEGRMPNPDVGCNSIVKFGAMREYAINRLGADCIATGHYARLWHRGDDDNDCNNQMPEFVEEMIADAPERDWIASWGADGGICSGGAGRQQQFSLPSLLLSGADLGKDQSYFLCGVDGNAFRNVMFPLGGLEKKVDEAKHQSSAKAGQESGLVNARTDTVLGPSSSLDACDKSVREIAIDAGLPTADKRESMGICFIGKRNFHNFISQYLPSVPKPGSYVDVDSGEIVGKHGGASHFTIGQGAKISGATQKWFVVGRSAADYGSIFVCGGTHHPALYSNELYVNIDDFNWVGGAIPPPLVRGERMVALCRTRHLQPLMPCAVKWDKDNRRLVIAFDRPVRAITPGQTAALYVGGGLICLGGGQISSAGPSYHELNLDLPQSLHPAGANDLSVIRRASAV